MFRSRIQLILISMPQTKTILAKRRRENVTCESETCTFFHQVLLSIHVPLYSAGSFGAGSERSSSKYGSNEKLIFRFLNVESFRIIRILYNYISFHFMLAMYSNNYFINVFSFFITQEL